MLLARSKQGNEKSSDPHRSNIFCVCLFRRTFQGALNLILRIERTKQLFSAFCSRHLYHFHSPSCARRNEMDSYARHHITLGYLQCLKMLFCFIFWENVLFLSGTIRFFSDEKTFLFDYFLLMTFYLQFTMTI